MRPAQNERDAERVTLGRAEPGERSDDRDDGQRGAVSRGVKGRQPADLYSGRGRASDNWRISGGRLLRGAAMAWTVFRMKDSNFDSTYVHLKSQSQAEF